MEVTDLHFLSLKIKSKPASSTPEWYYFVAFVHLLWTEAAENLIEQPALMLKGRKRLGCRSQFSVKTTTDLNPLWSLIFLEILTVPKELDKVSKANTWEFPVRPFSILKDKQKETDLRSWHRGRTNSYCSGELNVSRFILVDLMKIEFQTISHNLLCS